MFDTAIEFANIQKENCTPGKIINILAKNNIYWSQGGKERGFDTVWTLDNKAFHLTKPDDGIKNLRDKYKNTEEAKKIFFPSDPNFQEELWNEIKTIKNEMKSWLDYSIAHQGVDFARIKDFLEEHPLKVVGFSETDDPWQPDLGMTFDKSTLKNYIISHDFIWPVYQGKGHEFERIKCCPTCHTYLYANDRRQLFCNGNCRYKHFMRQKKEKGE